MPDSIQTASENLIRDLENLKASELEVLVRHHNDAYFVKNSPEISDAAFDQLVEALRAVKPSSSVLEELVEDVADASKVVAHSEPMLSLDKCYDFKKYTSWYQKLGGEVAIMPKIDGVACVIRYGRDGKLSTALTRGDGKKGENITENVRGIRDVPSAIPSPQMDIEVRGEVYLKKSRFEEKYAKDFVNTRNLTAGALKQKDAKKSAAYGLSFFPYDIRGTKLSSEQEKFEKLKEIGFHPPHVVFTSNLSEMERTVAKISTDRDAWDFDTDGIVFRLVDVKQQQGLGNTAHHPRWAIAYKFQDESAQTILENVEWSIGRMGTITPVAHVKPVFVGGATISRASLHNLGWLKKLGATMESTISMVRRGGVIPYVEKVIAPTADPIAIPTTCPSCKGTVVEDGDFLRCAHPEACHEVILQRIKYFCSVLEMKGFGPEIINQLVERKMVQEPADLYQLKSSELILLDRLGQKLADKLVDEVNKRRDLTLAEVLTSLGFEEVGPSVAEAIAENHPSIDVIQSLSAEELEQIDGIGPRIAESMVAGLRNNAGMVENLLGQVTIKKPVQLDTSTSKIAGQSFVFTGKMAHLDRKSAQKKVKELGGKTPGSVTSQTDYLVVGDDGSALLGNGKKSTKQNQAEKLVSTGEKVRIITETAFLELIK